MTPHVENLLAQARWRQDINKRGYEKDQSMASAQLTETLRTELRTILDNDGQPFDLNVARHVYDFAIAAKDLLTVSAKTVDEVVKVITDNNGAMESLLGPGEQPPEQASETFGARMLRELLAALPMLRTAQDLPDADMHTLVAAIADARDRGMPDVAAKLEQRLLGTPLEPVKITHAEVVDGSYEHGFLEGSMQDNFDRGTVDGISGSAWHSTSPAYRTGYEAGQARRKAQNPPPAADPVLIPPPTGESTDDSNGHTANGAGS